MWREADLEVNMYKTPQLRTTCGRCSIEKVHAVVAQSTFGSENVKITTRSGRFLTIRLPYDVEKVPAVVAQSREACLEVKRVKS